MLYKKSGNLNPTGLGSLSRLERNGRERLETEDLEAENNLNLL
jgi:hypothetical protein